jgi:predicted RNA-binding protein with PUA-like domain
MSALEDDSPHCYFAVYADPTVANHVTIEGGRFGNRAMPRNMDVGDMVLLYCTSSYATHPKTAPGIGLITAIDHNLKDFWYDYVPFEQPVPLEFIRFAITEEDQTRLANIRRDFLFQISRESFRAVTQAAKLKANRAADPFPYPPGKES